MSRMKKYIGKYDGTERQGDKYGYWTIIKYEDSIKHGEKKKVTTRRYLCECKCGKRKVVQITNLKSGLSQSCGCKPHKSKYNGLSQSGNIYYRLWSQMMSRCYNKNTIGYKNYGGRGISVYKNWLNPEKFIKEIIGLIGEKPSSKYSIDRINNDGNYDPDNIRWATSKQQMNNTRYSDKLTAKKLAELTGYSRERIRQLTYKTSSDNSNNGLPLKKFIIKEIKTNKKTHYIYKPEAIGFLMKRIKEKQIHQLLFTSFDYVKFMRNNVLYINQLAEMLNITSLTLRTHISKDKIRKEHYHLLKKLNYNPEPYLIKDKS